MTGNDGWQEPADLGDKSEAQREHLEAAALEAARSGRPARESIECDWDLTGWTGSEYDDESDLDDWTGYSRDTKDAEHQALHIIDDLDDLDDDLDSDDDLLGHITDLGTAPW